MKRLPVALSIAGFDPSGGAGILADLRAFAAAGTWGSAAIAVMTVQSTAGLVEALPTPARLLTRQIRELLDHQDVRAIKLGALGSVSNVRAVSKVLSRYAARVPLVIDPVMRATLSRGRGGPLLEGEAVRALRKLLRQATLVTPNADEAALLTGVPVQNLAGARSAAQKLVDMGARSALVKGGHLPGNRAVDVLALGDSVLALSSVRRANGGRVHGTGCTLASLVAGRLARTKGSIADEDLVAAVRWAKERLGRALAHPLRIGEGDWVLGP